MTWIEFLYVCFMKKREEEDIPKCDENVNVLVTNERLTDYIAESGNSIISEE